MTGHVDPHFIEGACICLCPECSGDSGCICPGCVHHQNPNSALHSLPPDSVTNVGFVGSEGAVPVEPTLIPVSPGCITVQWTYTDPRDAKIAELTEELELLRREYRVEAIHSDPEAPCDVCDHLMIEDALDRAEKAETELDEWRARAATARPHVEAALADWRRGHRPHEYERVADNLASALRLLLEGSD